MPRAVYSMAADGLLFRGLSHVHPRTQTPVVSIVIFGTISAVLALLIDIEVIIFCPLIGFSIHILSLDVNANKSSKSCKLLLYFGQLSFLSIKMQ